jgi:hypothetical protein
MNKVAAMTALPLDLFEQYAAQLSTTGILSAKQAQNTISTQKSRRNKVAVRSNDGGYRALSQKQRMRVRLAQKKLDIMRTIQPCLDLEAKTDTIREILCPNAKGAGD